MKNGLHVSSHGKRKTADLEQLCSHRSTISAPPTLLNTDLTTTLMTNQISRQDLSFLLVITMLHLLQ